MSDKELEISELSRSYGDVRALDRVSFRVAAGELFGFVGSNGAGKTSTMRIIVGVLAADSGEVRWDGVPMDPGIRRTIGYMPEERGLYPKMRVGEQLAYLARLHGADSASARRAAEEWAERLGVAGALDTEVQKLSLGNQQRVQLAAALVHDPRILVLDEPFSGLDPMAVDLLAGVLRDKCAEGVPVIFSSHQLDLVERLCDRVGVIRGGRLVASGLVDELRAAGPARLVVGAAEAADAALARLPGVTVCERQGGRVVVELADDADDQRVLRTALEAGPVTEFARRRPSLHELFREIVEDETEGTKR